MNGEITPRLLEIADAFSTAGLPTEAGVPYGELANPYAFAIIREIVKEAFAEAIEIFVNPSPK